jgi:antitoxin CcdA
MPTATEKRKTSLTLNAAALDEARELGLNVSALADAALQAAVREARRKRWLEENREAFAAQAKWHEEHGARLAQVMGGPTATTWK